VFEGNTAIYLQEGSVVFKARIAGNSYIVDKANAFTTDGGDKDSNLDKSYTELMHRRLGYTSLQDIEKLAQHSTGLRLGGRRRVVGRYIYESCLVGKLKEACREEVYDSWE